MTFNKSVNNSLKFLENPITATLLKAGLLLYASMAAPKLPDFMAELFENVFFRIAVLFLIVWTGHKDPAFALLVSVGFVVSMNALSGRKLFDAFAAAHDAEFEYSDPDLKEDIAREGESTIRSDEEPADDLVDDMYPEPEAVNVRPPQIPEAEHMRYDTGMTYEPMAPDAMEPIGFGNMAAF